MTRFSLATLRPFSNALFEASGLSPEHAALVTDVLIHADLRGHGSHGLTRIPIYAERIAAGAVENTARDYPQHWTPFVNCPWSETSNQMGLSECKMVMLSRFVCCPSR